MNTFKEHKVKLFSTGGWFSSETYEVVELECEAKKNGALVNSIQMFKGSISDCESYLRLLDSGKIER